MMTVSEQEGLLALSRLDGTLELRSLVDARSTARLIPTHKSGWANLKPDGSFVATPEAANVLVAERASDQKSWTLSEIANGVASNEVVLGTAGVERLQSGVASVKFALSSPAGMPQVKLDGVWDVPAMATSTPGMFEVEYLVRELRPRTQTVQVTGPRGASKELELSIPGDPGFLGQESRHQVLAVGLHEYENASVSDLESAANDAKLVAAEFRKPNTWNLDASQSRTALNLGGDALKTVLQKFLLEATADTTLLLFIAGHGDLQGGESVLLPVDYDPANTSKNLPAELLWGWVKASPAKHVVVVIDACHSGGFGQFQGKLVELAQDPAAQSRVIISSSSRTKPAMSGTSSGNFTRAFLKALSSPSAVDDEVGAITLYQAFAHAQVATIVQRPRMEGGEGLEKLVLATPPAPDNLVASSGKNHDQALSVSYDITQPRQIVARSMFDKVVNDELKLAIKFFEPAERLSIAVYAEGTSSALINYFESARDKAGGPGRWQRSDNLTTKIPLRKLKGRGSGRYRAELRPCAASGQCGPATKLMFDY
jgi:hypothetical protein